MHCYWTRAQLASRDSRRLRWPRAVLTFVCATSSGLRGTSKSAWIVTLVTSVQHLRPFSHTRVRKTGAQSSIAAILAPTAAQAVNVVSRALLPIAHAMRAVGVDALLGGSNEVSVQGTNDDAQVSKLSCTKAGYFKDDFIHFFVRKSAKRSPLINRGYYSRHSGLRYLLHSFLDSARAQGRPCQVLSLGAGFDTTWYQLQKDCPEKLPARYLEVDFKEVTKRKAAVVATQPALRDHLYQASNLPIPAAGTAPAGPHTAAAHSAAVHSTAEHSTAVHSAAVHSAASHSAAAHSVGSSQAAPPHTAATPSGGGHAGAAQGLGAAGTSGGQPAPALMGPPGPRHEGGGAAGEGSHGGAAKGGGHGGAAGPGAEAEAKADDGQVVIDVEGGQIVSPRYCLLPVDLRDKAALSAAVERAGLDLNAMTFILSECVMVYMEPRDSTALIAWLGSKFTNAALVVYEQIKPNDAFGRQMCSNLESRGCPLLGLHATPTLEAHMQRMTHNGWSTATSHDMDTIYKKFLDPVDKARAERLEMFDEYEEWHMIQEHYSITVARNDAAGVMGAVEFREAPQLAPGAPGGLPHHMPCAD